MTPEEAAKDDRDRFINGFAFFHKLDEIIAWVKGDADVLQIANTPLYKRSYSGDPSKCKLLVMHDYRGNYLPYEASQGAMQVRKDYIMEYWQYVETFNYFSHRRTTIPPPAWVNVGHRNGALVLGTFMIEPNSQDEPKKIFAENKSPTDTRPGKYILPDILAEMARVYGFDGWLLNFESMIIEGVDTYEQRYQARKHKWKDFSGEMLKDWVQQLKTQMDKQVPHGKVVW
jgi:endo-beta-N-acetylglucosaminidase D